MTGVYLQCDSCNKTLGEEQIRPKVSLGKMGGNELRRLAKELGWIITSQGDYCPDLYCHRIEAQRYNNV